jgi:hypothetical protein
MLRLELRCTGPEGPSNGCPESHPAFIAESHDGQDQLRVAFSSLVRSVEAAGWARGRDNAFRCPACLKASATPQIIAGIPYAKWIEALDRFCAGDPPSKWGGQDGLPTARQFNNVVHSRRYPDLRARWMQGPTYKADRKERSESLPEERWAVVLERFLAGEDKIDICTDEAGMWPSPKMWNGRMERDAAFRDAVNGEHERRRAARAAAIDWKRALTRFALGETLESLADDTDMPNKNEWHRRIQTDAGFRAEVIHARPTSSGAAKLLLGSGKFELVRRFMGEGLSLEAAVERARVEDPPAKLKGREFKFGVAHVAERLKIAKDAAACWLYQWHAPKVEGSRFWGWYDEEEFEAVIAHLKGPRPAAPPKAKKFKLAEQPELHHKSLKANALYAAADAAVSRSLPAHIRADVISQMVLDVLEGWLDLANLKTFAKDYVRKLDRESGRWNTVSLDAPIPGTDDLRLIDTLDTDTVRF